MTKKITDTQNHRKTKKVVLERPFNLLFSGLADFLQIL